jgi:ABC-type polysaccharide/polyol phosphate export permease
MSQDLALIRWFMLREMREIYHSKTMILTAVVTTVVTLGIYWFTSKAFAPSVASGLEGSDVNYFSYILIGDLTFLIPSLMFVGVADSIRRNAVDRSLELMLTSRVGPRKIIMLQLAALIPIEFVKAALTLLIAVLVFSFRLPAFSIPKVLFLQIFSLPLFIGLGLIAASILLRFSRGESVIGQISNLGIIFAGAYFPIAVFPETIGVISKIFSPFSVLLEGTRSMFNGANWPIFFNLSMIIIVWGIISFALGFWLIGKGLEFNRRKGSPFLFYR